VRVHRWRPVSWGFLIWAVFFPVGWCLLLLSAKSDDGESLRLLDLAWLGMVGIVIWAIGLAGASLIWLIDHWLASRRR
jgi:hypothetical protein